MLERLERLVDEIGVLHSKLIVLIGPSGSGKTRLLGRLADRRGAQVLNVGATLGSRLASLPQRQRPHQASVILRVLADEQACGDLLLLDNIELLFDRTLRLDPLELLKHHAHARRVVAAWPGELHDDRLRYAEPSHPEYQNYGLGGLVSFEVGSQG